MCIRDSPSDAGYAQIIEIGRNSIQILAFFYWVMALQLGYGSIPVSYTHLDVYKRQKYDCSSIEVASGVPEWIHSARRLPDFWLTNFF